MGKKKTDLTQGNITLQLLQFGLPIVVSMILQNLYNVADSLVVGRFIGDHALAAVGSTTSVSQFVLLLMGGATTGMGVIVSQYYGAGKEEEKNVKRAICTSFYIILMLAVVLGILGVLFSRQLLHGLMGVPEDVLEDSVLYLRIIFWGAVPTALYNMAFGISKALGDSVVPMLVLVVTCILNIGMNILFVAGFSMGGYGAWYLGLSRPDLYAKAASMSGALDIAGLYQSSTIQENENNPFSWEDSFGDPKKLAGSNYDLFALYDQDVAKGCVPKLYQAVGTDDFLYQSNLHVRDTLQKKNADLVYKEDAGGHDWTFWDKYIQDILDWLLQ